MSFEDTMIYSSHTSDYIKFKVLMKVVYVWQSVNWFRHMNKQFGISNKIEDRHAF